MPTAATLTAVAVSTATTAAADVKQSASTAATGCEYGQQIHMSEADAGPQTIVWGSDLQKRSEPAVIFEVAGLL